MAEESLSAAFPRAQKTALKARQLLGRLEKNLDRGQHDADDLEGQVAGLINQLQRETSVLQMMVRQEPRARRQLWSTRVEQLIEDTGSLRSAFEVCLQRNRGNRNELMRGMRRRNEHGEDMLLQENEALLRSKRNIDMMIDMGKGLVTSARDQGSVLKRAQRTAMNMANTMGLSSSLVKIIRKREAQDRLIVLLGMILTILIIAAVYYFVRVR